jgi:hypothetical protein
MTRPSVPDELAPIYEQALRGADVRAAVADYWRNGVNPTPEGAAEVQHTSALAAALRRRESFAEAEAIAAAMRELSRCPACDGVRGLAMTRSGLCKECTRVDDLLLTQQLASEVIDGTSRGERIAQYREGTP